MVLPELQALAASLGISGTARMRKGQLIEAITARQARPDRRADSSPSSSAPADRSEAPRLDDAPSERGNGATAANQSDRTPSSRTGLFATSRTSAPIAASGPIVARGETVTGSSDRGDASDRQGRAAGAGEQLVRRGPAARRTPR